MTLLICGLLTAGALIYVFYIPGPVYSGPVKTRLGYLFERKEAVYENLRDLSFEFKAGKFPESDYVEMRTALEDEAAAIVAEISRLQQGTPGSSPRDRKGARV